MIRSLQRIGSRLVRAASRASRWLLGGLRSLWGAHQRQRQESASYEVVLAALLAYVVGQLPLEGLIVAVLGALSSQRHDRYHPYDDIAYA